MVSKKASRFLLSSALTMLPVKMACFDHHVSSLDSTRVHEAPEHTLLSSSSLSLEEIEDDRKMPPTEHHGHMNETKTNQAVDTSILPYLAPPHRFSLPLQHYCDVTYDNNEE